MDKIKITTIQEDFQLYLKAAYKDPARLHPEQMKQLRHTFFASAAMIMSKSKTQIAEMEDNDAVEALETLHCECMEFFMNLKP